MRERERERERREKKRGAHDGILPAQGCMPDAPFSVDKKRMCSVRFGSWRMWWCFRRESAHLSDSCNEHDTSQPLRKRGDQSEANPPSRGTRETR